MLCEYSTGSHQAEGRKGAVSGGERGGEEGRVVMKAQLVQVACGCREKGREGSKRHRPYRRLRRAR